MASQRKIVAFEVLLLLVGLVVALAGILLLRTLYLEEPGMSWSFFTAVSLWLVLLFVIVMTAVLFDVKEELAVVIKDQLAETRLLRMDMAHHVVKNASSGRKR